MYIQNTLKNVEKVDLVTATIPNTVYNITNGTNVMLINTPVVITTATISIVGPITFPEVEIQVTDGNCSFLTNPIDITISGTTIDNKSFTETYTGAFKFIVNTSKPYDPESIIPDYALINVATTSFELRAKLNYSGYVTLNIIDVIDDFNYIFIPVSAYDSVFTFNSGAIALILPIVPISINPGFYSACNIITTIISTQSVISGKFVEAEGKIYFYSSNAFTIVINSQELANIIGFTQGKTYTAVLDGTTYYIKSNTVVNMKTLGDYIFLDILELRRPYESDAVSNVYGSESFINFATIPMDVDSGSIKTFKEMSDYRVSVTYPKTIDRIDRLTVNWFDTNGNSINFNGVDENSFILRFYMKDDERIDEPDFSEKTMLPPKMVSTNITNYFILALVSILFILFIKNK
jgi:hypothetical protein